MTGRDRAFMHGQLASVGIVLEPSTAGAPRAAEPPVSAVDREAVRAILVAAGAPAGDIDWLVNSCPSLEDARGYRPPAREAWCVACDGVRMCDAQGCLACRGSR